jgi:hypothetical protein
MYCERHAKSIQELADGTLGSIRRIDLESHLKECEPCRRLADDLVRIRELAGSLERPAPPDRVWLQVAGRLRQEGRITAPAAPPMRIHRYAPLALAASLLLIVGASLYVLYPRGVEPPARQASGNAPAAAPVETYRDVESEFRLAEQHYQNGIAKLEEAAKSDDDVIDPQTAAMLRKNLDVVDQAIAESRAATRSDPQSVAAWNSLFVGLKRKVVVLQDTIALMNQMRKGDAAGAAQIVDGVNKS